MNRIRKKVTSGMVILALLLPGGLIALPQSAAKQQKKQESSASPAPQENKGGAKQPAAQPTSNQNYIEVERPTPFGIQRFRVPKGSPVSPSVQPVPQPSRQGRPATAAAKPPSPPSPPTQVPAATAPQQQPAAPQQQAKPAPQPAPAPAKPQATPAASQTVPIALHLENANLLQVIGIIASELKMNYVVDPKVKGVVNINTLGEVHRSDLFPLLQMILRINGATAVQTGNFFRIVPLKDVQRMPIEPLLNEPASGLPSDDRMVMNIIPLKYVAAADMTKILTPFLSEGGHLFSEEAGNILIVTDSSRSMKRLMELVAMFDSEVFTNQRVRLYQIKNSEAAKVAKEMKEIFSAYGLSSDNAAIRFVAIDRINSVLVVTANPSVYPEVEKWLQRLDQPGQASGIRNFVYKVENGQASDLASVLAQVLGLTGAPSQMPARGARRAQSQAGLPIQQAAAQRATLPGMPEEGPNATPIRIVPDVINNQLVIQATAQEYAQIKQTLRQLDIIPRQVLIQAKVYEVDLTGDLSAGVSAFLQNRDNAERKPLGSFDATQGAAALSASVGTLIGKTRELMMFLNAQETHNRARVISAPTVLASDNLPASIDVGTTIPVLTSQGVTQGAQVAGSSLFTNTIQNIDTGVLLTITPRINSSGLVNLRINQEVSTPLPPTGPIQSPSIQKRSIATQVVVESGQTIALGGIIQETRQLNRNRIPLLGDIPYLGAVFGTTTYSRQRTEMILLLTPTVIRTVSEAQQATTEMRNKLRELRSIMANDEAEEKEQQQEKKSSPETKKKKTDL